MDADIRFAFKAVAIFILCGALLCVLVNWLQDMNCKSVAQKMGVQYQYGFFSGCMIKTEDGWILLNRYFVTR